MVKLRKIKTESPATTLGILSFGIDTGGPKISPQEFFVILAIFIAIELALAIFFPI